MKLTPATKAELELRQARLGLEAAERDAGRHPAGSRERFLAGHALKLARERMQAAEAAVAAIGGQG